MTYKSGTLNPTQSINQRKSTRYHGQLKKRMPHRSEKYRQATYLPGTGH